MTDLSKIRQCREEAGCWDKYIANKLEMITTNKETQLDRDYCIYAITLLGQKKSFECFKFYKHIYNNLIQIVDYERNNDN